MTSPATGFAQILKAVGVEPPDMAPVAITGADPVLPTRFRMGAAGAATLAAVGSAAAALWRARGGCAQEIKIDLRHAALALRANSYLRIGDSPAADPWDDISGFHRGADGRWIQLHCQFPHFHDGVLALLGCDRDRAQVANAIAGWSTPELEDAMAARGLPAFMVRDAAEWEGHAQGRAVADLPLFEIERIGAAPPEPLPAAGRPLGAIRVLDLARVIAGPMVGRTLAEHGADVLRISGPGLPYIESLVIDTGHGKRAAEIDLGAASGQATLERLIAGADVFSQSYRPGSLAARGFGPEVVAARRPGIVYVSLSAWSHKGPWAARRGYDTLVQCATGIAAEQGRDGNPAHLPGSALDYLTGYLGAFGVMVALDRRAREGGSWHVRLSLAQTAEWLKRLGRVSANADPRHIAPPEPEAVGAPRQFSDTAWGRIGHLGPVLEMSATPPGWDRPARPLGSDSASWPARPA